MHAVWDVDVVPAVAGGQAGYFAGEGGGGGVGWEGEGEDGRGEEEEEREGEEGGEVMGMHFAGDVDEYCFFIFFPRGGGGFFFDVVGSLAFLCEGLYISGRECAGVLKCACRYFWVSRTSLGCIRSNRSVGWFESLEDLWNNPFWWKR